MRIIRNAAACASGGEDSFFTEMYTLRIRLPVEVFKMYDRLTKGDIEKMEREIEERKLVKRPELIEAVKEARAQGDLSENFEYYAAKREKNQNESRIRFLERMIKTAKIIEDDTAENEAGINKKVTLYIPEDDVEEVYTIVSTMRQNSLKGLISVESPLGKALQHHKTGDTITVKVNSNYSYQAVIRKVEDSEEAESASLRNY